MITICCHCPCLATLYLGPIMSKHNVKCLKTSSMTWCFHPNEMDPAGKTLLAKWWDREPHWWWSKPKMEVCLEVTLMSIGSTATRIGTAIQATFCSASEMPMAVGRLVLVATTTINTCVGARRACPMGLAWADSSSMLACGLILILSMAIQELGPCARRTQAHSWAQTIHLS